MSDRMQKVKDFTKLKSSELEYIREIERQNLERVAKLKRIRRNNIITGSLLGVGVLAIYGYSMYAVKQETFLDDFEEPQKSTQ